MPGNEKPLLLGDGHIRMAGQFIGNISNAYVDKAVVKATHQTNYGLEYRTDHVLAISTAYNLGFTMMDINPENVNLLLGSPGFSAVPTDRSLPGERRDISLLSYGLNRMQFTEETKLKLDVDSKALWSPLTYPIAAANAGALVSPIISMSNQAFAGSVVSYQAYCVLIQNAADPTTQSLPSNIEFVPFNEGPPGHEALLLVLKSPYGHVYVNTDEISIYMADVARDPITKEWDFSSGTGMNNVFPLISALTDTGWMNEALSVPVAGSPTDGWLIDGDSTSGTFFGVDLYGDTGTSDGASGPAVAIPTSAVPILIQTYASDSIPSSQKLTDAVWLVDFMYEQERYAGGSVKLTKNSTITHATTCRITYFYDAAQVRELPLIGMGQNPVIPITLDIVYPNGKGKMIWNFYKAQINTNMRMATNANDWWGVDFTAETLDASDLYPRYGFGFVQYTGDLINSIKDHGNIPFGNTVELGTNQSQFA